MRTADELAEELRRRLPEYKQRSDINDENVKGAEFMVRLAEYLSDD